MRELLRQVSHDCEKGSLPFEAETRPVAHPDIAVLDLQPIDKAAEHAERVEIVLAHPKAEARGGVECHLVARMRHDLSRRPAFLRKHVENLCSGGNSVV